MKTTPTRQSHRKASRRGEGRPSPKPKKITDTAWWYEDKRGIEIIQECRSNGQYIKTLTARIPWSKVLKAAARCSALTPSKP